MPCCQIPNPAAPVFPPTLIPDAKRFSKYAGGATLVDIGTIAPLTVLTSALHLEMKLWNTGESLPHPPYRINGAEHNSWLAMRARGRNTFSEDEKEIIFAGINPGTPAPKQCVLTTYDGWLLATVLGLRTQGMQPVREAELHPAPHHPAALSTVGRCQKLLNVFLKHELCWHVAGRWVGYPQFVLYAPPRSPDLPQYLCALHAPIDRVVLKALTALPLGLGSEGKNLLKNNGDVKQSSDGNFHPWSQLNCLRTYYGLQLMLRRIAMNTWPVGCACGGASGGTPAAAAKKLTQDCADWFEKEFGPKHPRNNHPDWIEVACELTDEVIKKTLEKIGANATDSGSGGSAPAALRTNPSSCESSGEDQPAVPSSGCPQCDLGNAILAEHRSRLGAHPGTLPPVGVAVVVQHRNCHRIRCSSAYGWAWQYHVSLKTVRVDLFSEQGPQAAAVNRYNTFCAPRVNPPFPGYPPFPPGITGNQSRSIRKSTRTGANAGHANFPNIAKEAVDIMQQIFAL